MIWGLAAAFGFVGGLLLFEVFGPRLLDKLARVLKLPEKL